MTIRKIALYVGVVTSDITNLSRLLASFKTNEIEQLDHVDSLKFLIYINEENIDKYKQLQSDFTITFFCHQDLHQSPFKKLTITESRQFIHYQLYRYTHNKIDAYGWVADDDLEIDSRFQDYLKWLPKFKKEGFDVVISPCEGEPANCFYSGIRGQLFDFFENYKWLIQLPSKSLLPNRSPENVSMRKRFPEYYYDLTALHDKHLLTPCWLEPVSDIETVGEALARLKEYGLKLLDGRSFFRQVKIDLFENPIANARTAINKGGNAFILTPQTLLTENITLQFNGRYIRRSDMVWSLINTTYHNYKIVSTHFPVIHHGSNQGQTHPSKMVDEIIATCLIHTLREHLKSKSDWGKLSQKQEKLQKSYVTNLNNRLNLFIEHAQFIHQILEEMLQITSLHSFASQFTERFSQPLAQIEEDIRTVINTSDLSMFIELLEKKIKHVNKEP